MNAISQTGFHIETRVSETSHELQAPVCLQAVASTVGVRQSGESPGDREAQTVTDVGPHSYGSVYRDRQGGNNRGLLHKALMIRRQKNRAETNELAAVGGTSV